MPTVLLAWGGGASRYRAEVEADELDDLILTSRRDYRLVRRIGGPVSGGLLIYRYLDRAHGNGGRVPVAALSAGPGMSRRPVDGTWRPFPAAAPEHPVAARRYAAARAVSRAVARVASPPSAPVRPAPPTAPAPAPRAR